MKKRIVSIILAVCLLLPLVTVEGLAEDANGTWEGSGLSWSYAESTKTLTITGNGVIPDGALTGNLTYQHSVEHIIIESGVTSVGQGAFSVCSALTSVEFQGVTGIGESAFQDCTNLTEVTFDGEVGNIGKNAFAGCGKLSNISFPGKVGDIGERAFNGCAALETLEFKGAVGNIGNYAFNSCQGLSSLEFPSTVGNVGTGAFSDCYGLTNVKFTGDVGDIGKQIFAGSDKLFSLTFGGNVGAIADEAFAKCISLDTVQFAGDVTSIGASAFAHCTTLTSVEFKGKVGNIGKQAFAYCDRLTNLLFTDTSDGIIDEEAFAYCSGLRRVVLPSGVTSIGKNAFNWCDNLSAIYIPDSVQKIASAAFDNDLKDIYYGGTEDQWKGMESRPQQNEGIPGITYNAAGLPDPEACSAEKLKELLKKGIDPVQMDIMLTEDVTIDETLYVQIGSNILLDLNGHSITSSANPAFKIAGSLTVMDSAPNSKGYENSISGSTVMDVMFGGSFTLESGTVKSTANNTAIVLTGAENADKNKDDIKSTITIKGGNVDAVGPAISVSGHMAEADIRGGEVSSTGDATILISDTNKENSPSVYVYGGTISNTKSNGAGIRVETGSLWVENRYSLEINVTPKISLVQGEASNHSISCTISNKLLDEFEPDYTLADESTQELKTLSSNGSTKYFFGDKGSFAIKFNLNGAPGSDPEEKMTDSSGHIGELPEPEWTGHELLGWSEFSDGLMNYVTPDSIVTKNTTLFAIWKADGQHIITFYKDGVPADHKLTGTDGVLAENGWPDLSEGYTGWYTSDGIKIDQDTHKFTNNTTVYAYTVTDNGPYEITFDFDNGASNETRKTNENGILESWPTDPTKTGQAFLGWTAASSNVIVEKTNRFNTNTTLHARWMPEDGYEVKFYLDASDTTEEYAQLHTNLKLFPTLDKWPRTPLVEGKFFTGWYDAPDSGSRLATNHTFTADADVYAHWLDTVPAGCYAITFNYNDGSTTSASSPLLTDPDTKQLSFLPYEIPEREGYTFDGWFIKGENDTEPKQVTAETEFSADTTVYAHWTKVGDSDTTYTLTVTGGTANSSKYKAGDTVTITANPPDNGKVFDKWTSEDNVEFADAASASTTFTMPEHDVTVTATYKDAAPEPEQTYTLTVTGGEGGGEYKAGAEVEIKANAAPDGKVFDKWTTNNGGTFVDATSANTTFKMPANAVTVTATYKDAAPEPEQTYTLTVTGGEGGGKYAAGTEVTIKANAAPDGRVFDKWTTSNNVIFADANSATTKFTMPASDVTVTATYKNAPETPPQTYTLTVTDGTGGGEYASGATVTITANTAPEGKEFDHWTTSNGGTFADANSASTTFTMPANDVTVTAHYKDAATTPEPTGYVITFNPRGGTVTPTNLVTGADGKLPSIPVPVYKGYIFDGWYTSPSGGSYVSLNTVFRRDTVVYAHWITESSLSDNRTPSRSEYSVVAPSTTGGTVRVSRDYAAEGTSVTVTVTPDIGYTLTSLTARDSWWNELELTDRGGGQYRLTMPNKAVTVSAMFTPVTQQPVGSMTAAPGRVWPYPGFTDVSVGAWYYDAVRFVCETGLMKGLGSNTFSPNTNLSRAQLTQILYNMAGTPATNGISGFSDVAPGDWYANAAAWAVSNGIIDGLDSGSFGPSEYVTREEIVVMLWRYAGKPASERELYFNDTANISSHAYTAVRWAVERGILSGNTNGALTPKSLATRVQVAQMLKNFFGA